MPVYQVESCLADLQSYAVIEGTLAGTLEGVAPQSVEILNFSHFNKDTVKKEHYLRRSDPKFRFDFNVMVYGEQLQEEAISTLESVAMPAVTYQLLFTMENAALPREYQLAVLGIKDVRKAEGPAVETVNTTLPPDPKPKISGSIRSSLPPLLFLLSVVVNLVRQ